MNLNIEHRTYYAYKAPVNYTIRQLRLTPQDGFGQRVKRWAVRANGHTRPHADAYGNLVHTMVLDAPHNAVSITAYGELETGLDIPPVQDSLPLLVYLRTTALTSMDEALVEFAARYGPAARGKDEQAIYALMRALHETLSLSEGYTASPRGACSAFGAGMCGIQDYVHVFIACCRYLGVPARYVSGYRYAQDGEKMENHAWADVWLQRQEWLSLDPISAERANSIHIRVASGLDDRNARPITGVPQFDGTATMTSSLHAIRTT